MREVVRTWVNNYQLKYCKRVKAAARESAVVIAASTEAQRDLQRTLGIEIPVHLETGLSHKASPPKPDRDPLQPLRVLWAGRLRQWKALPILLHAMAKLPLDVKVQLRVLGTGSSLKSWKALATQLGVSETSNGFLGFLMLKLLRITNGQTFSHLLAFAIPLVQACSKALQQEHRFWV